MCEHSVCNSWHIRDVIAADAEITREGDCASAVTVRPSMRRRTGGLGTSPAVDARAPRVLTPTPGQWNRLRAARGWGTSLR